MSQEKPLVKPVVILYRRQGNNVSKYSIFIGTRDEFNAMNIKCKKLEIKKSRIGKDVRQGQLIFIQEIPYIVEKVKGSSIVVREQGCEGDIEVVTDDMHTALESFLQIFGKVTVSIDDENRIVKIRIENPSELVVDKTVYSYNSEIKRIVNGLSKYYTVELTTVYFNNVK